MPKNHTGARIDTSARPPTAGRSHPAPHPTSHPTSYPATVPVTRVAAAQPLRVSESLVRQRLKALQQWHPVEQLIDEGDRLTRFGFEQLAEICRLKLSGYRERYGTPASANPSGKRPALPSLDVDLGDRRADNALVVQRHRERLRQLANHGSTLEGDISALSRNLGSDRATFNQSLELEIEAELTRTFQQGLRFGALKREAFERGAATGWERAGQPNPESGNAQAS